MNIRNKNIVAISQIYDIMYLFERGFDAPVDNDIINFEAEFCCDVEEIVGKIDEFLAYKIAFYDIYARGYANDESNKQ